MIIKLLERTVIDGKLREKGEIVRVKSFDGEYKIIKKREINDDRRITEAIKKAKIKNDNLKKNGKTKQDTINNKSKKRNRGTNNSH